MWNLADGFKRIGSSIMGAAKWAGNAATNAAKKVSDVASTAWSGIKSAVGGASAAANKVADFANSDLGKSVSNLASTALATSSPNLSKAIASAPAAASAVAKDVGLANDVARGAAPYSALVGRVNEIGNTTGNSHIKNLGGVLAQAPGQLAKARGAYEFANDVYTGKRPVSHLANAVSGAILAKRQRT